MSLPELNAEPHEQRLIGEHALHPIAVIVVSCDKYADLWKPFFALFRKFWPDCPYTTYLLSNHAVWADNSITGVQVGDDTSWSGNLRRSLVSIKEDNVIMFLDDLFLLKPVDTDGLKAICAEFLKADGNCLKLNPTVRGDKPHNVWFDQSFAGAPYRVSTVLTLWKKSLLNELLTDGETAWEFEIKGSNRSDMYDGFYVAKAPHFEITNGVIKGRWSRLALKRVRSRSHPFTTSRAMMSRLGELAYQMAVVRSKVLGWLLPARSARRVLDWLRRGRDLLMRPKYLARH
jgi:hypothetical protein